MAGRETLIPWVRDALVALGGKAKIVDVAKQIWRDHESELKASGDLFYRWQYDMRWAALELRKKNILRDVDELPRGVWALK